MNVAHAYKQGFTIVELLIVIVVIAILASVTVVAYSGVQSNARFAVMKSDFDTIRKALELYRVDNGQYPDSALCDDASGSYHYRFSWCGWNQGDGESFIPGLSPKYLSHIPNLDTSLDTEDSYLYQSRAANGSGAGGEQYQLIRFKREGLSAVEIENEELLLIGDGYDGLAWGYKSNPSTAWW